MGTGRLKIGLIMCALVLALGGGWIAGHSANGGTPIISAQAAAKATPTPASQSNGHSAGQDVEPVSYH